MDTGPVPSATGKLTHTWPSCQASPVLTKSRFPVGNASNSVNLPVAGWNSHNAVRILLSSSPTVAMAEREKTTAEIIVYPKMLHGFHADYRRSYQKIEAEDAWRRMLAWFKKHAVP